MDPQQMAALLQAAPMDRLPAPGYGQGLAPGAQATAQQQAPAAAAPVSPSQNQGGSMDPSHLAMLAQMMQQAQQQAPNLPPGVGPSQLSGREYAQQLTGGGMLNPGNLSPEGMRRYIQYGTGGGFNGDTPEQRTQALQAFLGTMQGATGQQAEQRQLAQMVSQQGLAQQDLRMKQVLGASGMSNRKTLEQLLAGIAAKGGSGADMQEAVKNWNKAMGGSDVVGLLEQMGVPLPTASSQQGVTGSRSVAPLTAAPGQVQLGGGPGRETAAAQLTTPTAYSGVQDVLDQFAKPVSGKPGTTIGQFLGDLDRSKPGFVRQNISAVIPYIQNTWGADAADQWLQGTNQTRLFSQPTEEENMRSAMLNLLGENGEGGTRRASGPLGVLLSKMGVGLGPRIFGGQ